MILLLQKAEAEAKLTVLTRVFDKKFCLVPNWLKSYMPTAPQSMMDQLYSISIEGLNRVRQKGATGLLMWVI